MLHHRERLQWEQARQEEEERREQRRQQRWGRSHHAHHWQVQQLAVLTELVGSWRLARHANSVPGGARPFLLGNVPAFFLTPRLARTAGSSRRRRLREGAAAAGGATTCTIIACLGWTRRTSGAT